MGKGERREVTCCVLVNIYATCSCYVAAVSRSSWLVELLVFNGYHGNVVITRMYTCYILFSGYPYATISPHDIVITYMHVTYIYMHVHVHVHPTCMLM